VNDAPVTYAENGHLGDGSKEQTHAEGDERRSVSDATTEEATHLLRALAYHRTPAGKPPRVSDRPDRRWNRTQSSQSVGCHDPFGYVEREMAFPPPPVHQKTHPVFRGPSRIEAEDAHTCTVVGGRALVVIVKTRVDSRPLEASRLRDPLLRQGSTVQERLHRRASLTPLPLMRPLGVVARQVRVESPWSFSSVSWIVRRNATL
jgi:hypothetical protein